MTFTNAPVSRMLVLGLVSASIGASLLDVKHYFYILIDTHLWRYGQFWRLLAYQLCYTNSTEVLFAAIAFYNMRSVERLWGSRKYVSFLIISSIFTAILPPLLMAMLRPLAPSLFNYIPAGPTPLLFAVLAQYHAMVPHMYKYRIATSQAPPSNEPFTGLTLSDKSYQYAIAGHMAILQWPGSLIGATVGWLTGHAYRSGVMPMALVNWRVPGWMVGVSSKRHSAEFEGLRRRLEGDGAATSTGAATGQEGQSADRRRTMGEQIVNQFREAL